MGISHRAGEEPGGIEFGSSGSQTGEGPVPATKLDPAYAVFDALFHEEDEGITSEDVKRLEQGERKARKPAAR